MANDPVTQMTADPDFAKMPLAEQQKALAAHDPSFAQMGSDDITKFVQAHQSRPQPTTANNSIENAAPKPYYGFTPSNLLGNVKEGFGQLYGTAKGAVEDIGNLPWSGLAKKYITDPADVENQKAQTAKTPYESVGHSIAAALPFLGPWAAGLGEQGGSGDIGGALARGGTQVAAMKAAGPVLRGAKAVADPYIDTARTNIQNAAYQELPAKGPTLTPGASHIAKGAGAITGAGIGAATGIPRAGEAGFLAGYGMGPTFLKQFLGTPELGNVRNPGPFSKVPARLPVASQGDPFNPSTRPNQLPFLPRSSEPLIMTPEEVAAFNQKQVIATRLAKERGMQYAGGVRTAGKNKPANRLFP